jgi:hypothetical protein
MSIATIINGRPTRAQVEKLFQRVNEGMVEGEVVNHQTVGKLIGEDPKSQRYQTIIGVTRRRLINETGFFLQSEHGVGYRKATGHDQVKVMTTGLKRAARTGIRAVKVGAAVSDERLPIEADRTKRDFVVQQAKYMTEQLKLAGKQWMLMVSRTEALPQ